MRSVVPFLVLACLVPPFRAFSQECTGWNPLLDTDPTHSKYMSGDTNAAYGVLGFIGDPGKKLVVKGTFPNSRFMSITTTQMKKEINVDAILDFNIEPDPGSQNPFRPNVPIDTPNRSYTVELLPPGVASQGKNVVRLADNHKIQAILYRIYSPNAGLQVDTSWLPHVFAYDAETGAPTDCPKHFDIPTFFRFPQFLTIIIPKRSEFDFQAGNTTWGPNSAIPYYLFGDDRVRQGDEVMQIRFKAPTFVNTLSGTGPFTNIGDVRYWSICVQNIVRNQTLACLPDWQAKTDASGFVHFVWGLGDDVRQAAESRGYNFIEDTRGNNQKTVVMFYRNMLPNAAFEAQNMYKGDYLPHANLCSRDAFLKRQCP
jgi:hypothetical protein